MKFNSQIGCSGAFLDSLLGAAVLWGPMSRCRLSVFLIALAGAGCSGTPPTPQANEMAPTPRLDEPKAKQAAPPAIAPAAATSGDGIAARVNNDIITWKDVRDVLKDI